MSARGGFLALRYARAYPRLFLALALMGVVFALAPSAWSVESRALIAWNVGAAALIVSLAWMVARSDHDRMKRRAAEQDVNPAFIVSIVVVATLASLAAIGMQLGASKSLAGWDKAGHIGLAVATIVTGWIAAHLLFTLHYAHEYYGDGSDGARGGLDFPGEPHPRYVDFLYFAFVIAVATQTADIAIRSRAMRGLALAQGVFAFFYNLAILGLTVNIAASLI